MKNVLLCLVLCVAAACGEDRAPNFTTSCDDDDAGVSTCEGSGRINAVSQALTSSAGKPAAAPLAKVNSCTHWYGNSTDMGAGTNQADLITLMQIWITQYSDSPTWDCEVHVRPFPQPTTADCLQGWPQGSDTRVNTWLSSGYGGVGSIYTIQTNWGETTYANKDGAGLFSYCSYNGNANCSDKGTGSVTGATPSGTLHLCRY
jgi:hypothetical protein